MESDGEHGGLHVDADNDPLRSEKKKTVVAYLVGGR